MALKPEFVSVELEDSLFAFPQGMHAGMASILLPKTQLSFLTNGTVRGDFPWHRPPFRKMTLAFSTSALQNAFQSANFQGACSFNPLIAADCIMCSIGGQIFQITPGVNGTATVVSANPPNDLGNPASPPQVWMFQSERWMIINDGQSVPIFADGVSSRRSNMGGYAITVQNVSDTNTGNTYALGTAVAMPSSNVYAQLYAGLTLCEASPNGGGQVIAYSWPSGLSVGNSYFFVGFGYQSSAVPAQVIIGNDLWAVGPTTTFRLNSGPFPGCVSTQLLLQFQGTNVTPLASPTNYPNGTNAYAATPAQLVGAGPHLFTVPAIGHTATAWVSQPYTGPIGGPIFLNGQAYTVTAVGNPPFSSIQAAQELPPGRMGCNAGGRTWLALPDGKSYIGSDLTGDQSSGTINYQYTDAVLHIQENTLLAGGGAFRIPANNGNIQAMVATATLDASLGQGPVEILSPTQVWSDNAPTDRMTWNNLTYPIQSVSLLGSGGLSQWSTIPVNSDTFFRALDGIRSLVLARRDFDVWGNVPYSEEVEPIVVADNTALLNFSSAIYFDNRVLMTANPVQLPQGVYHNRIIALNCDPVAGLTGKAPSVYDGIWTGLNVLQLVTGTFAGVQRAFAFHLNLSGTSPIIELWEILTSVSDPDFLPVQEITLWSNPSNHFDNGNMAIPMAMVSPMLDFGQKDPRIRKYLQLNNGEIYVDHMSGTVQFEVWYKPDDYPFWTLWLRWTEKSSTTPPGGYPDFRPRMGLGTPSGDVCDTVNNRPLREGYLFQVKVIITGNARFKGARFSAVTIPQPKYAAPNCKQLLTPGP